MKKALVVFLILAVAGGLFAQTTAKFTGSVQTGLGIGFDDNDDSKALVDFVRNRGEQGIRGDVTANISSGPDNQPYGAFGGEITLRVRQDNILNKSADGNGILAKPDTSVKLWWVPNSFVRLDVGKGGPGGYGTMGGIDRSQDTLDGNGLKITLTPVSGLTLGAHALYGASVKNLEDMELKFGAKYAVPSLLNVAANLYYLAANKADKAEKVRFGVGANYVGLSAMGLTKIAADFGTYGFGTDDFFMGVGEAVGFATGGLTLGVKAQQFIWLGEGSKDVMPMLFQGDIAYKVSPVVTVGIEGRYKIGALPSYNYRNAGEIGGVDSVAAFSAKDVAGLGISPQITFSVGPTINVGYNLQMDMSKDKPATSAGKTMQHLIYATAAISF
jgi:hypothetical protein